jgi:outer membrane protein TolC
VLSVGSRRDRGAYDPTYTNSVGVELTVPLGLTSQAGPAIASQALAVAEAQAEFKRTQREVEANWQQAQQRLTSTRQAQQVAEQRSTLAKRNLQMAQSAFNLGEIDLMDLLRVREQSLNAMREREQQSLLLERAIALCNQSAGVIP